MPEDKTDPTRLQQIAGVLLKCGVRFIVIGGQAEYIFGSARVTFDVDLCYQRTPENLARLANALKELGVTLRGAPKDLVIPLDARALSLGNNYTFDTPMGPLDLLGWVEPIGDYDRLEQNASSYRIGERDYRVIDLDDLITIRRHLKRDKDNQSLVQLLAIKKMREDTGQS